MEQFITLQSIHGNSSRFNIAHIVLYTWNIANGGTGVITSTGHIDQVEETPEQIDALISAAGHAVAAYRTGAIDPPRG